MQLLSLIVTDLISLFFSVDSNEEINFTDEFSKSFIK